MSERIALGMVFLLGVTSMALSIVRFIRVDHTTKWQPQNFKMTEVAIWTILELQIAMIAGCLPSLRVLLRDKRNSRTTSTVRYWNEKFDQLDNESEASIYGTMKSNYTYATNSYPIPSTSDAWKFTEKNRIDSFGYPLAPGVTKSQFVYGNNDHYEASPNPTTNNRASSHYSLNFGNANINARDSKIYEMYNNRVTLAADYTATIAQLPTAYTPPQKYGHSRGLSVDSTSSTVTSEEVMITMALSPGLPRRAPSYRKWMGDRSR